MATALAKGCSCCCLTFIPIFFYLYFTSFSDFFCKYLSFYFFQSFRWPPFAGLLFVLIFSHAEGAFCLILFGSQIAADTNNTWPTTRATAPATKCVYET